MLWSLGLAALTGVLSVFIQHRSFMWRIIGTEFAAAFACALILPCIPMIDRERTRAAGLLGMPGVVIEFFLALILIWDLPNAYWGVQWDGEMLATMALLGLGIAISMWLMPLTYQFAYTVTAWLGLAVVILAFGAFLVAIWLARRYQSSDDWAATGAAITVMGVLVSICLLGLGGSPRRSWRWVGVLCGVAALALWMYDIWIGPGSDLGFVISTGLVAVSALVAYTIVCILCTLKQTQLWFRGAAMIAAALLAVLIELMVIDDRFQVVGLDDLWLGRCTAASGIVTACGTLALAVLVRINRRVDFEPSYEAITDITIVCPRCRKKQSIRIGDAVCSVCQLRISIRVEEPRCSTCDYLLVGLTSDRCPECGAKIRP